MDVRHTLRRWTLVMVVTGVVIWVPAVPGSDEGQEAANQVSEASYRSYLGDNQGVAGILYTHNGNNRGNGPQHDLARTNIYNTFQSFGLSVALEPFTYSSTTYYNVVATQTGTVYPTRIYIIGAHFDSVNNPGADDNASGTALVLEAARVLSQYDSDATIKYVAFDREEQGLIGSEAYVSAHGSSDIRGMLSLDMVAYDTLGDDSLLYGRSASNPIKAALGSAIVMYGGLTWQDDGQLDASDHAPFEQAGFQACLLIEGDVWSNPYYHTSQDSVDMPNYINYAYAVKMARSVVGWLVDNAGVEVAVNALDFSYPNGQPEFFAPAGGTRMPVVVTGVGTEVPQPGTGQFHYNLGSGWQTAAMDVISDNVYEAIFPAATCGADIQYYVSATAVSSTVFKDPRSAPTATYTATAAYGRIVAYENLLNSNPGWTTQGQWAFGQPTGQGGEYGEPDPTSGHTGVYVYGYNLSGDYPNNLAETHLTSTAINCTGSVETHLQFWRWLGVEQPQYDHAYVRVSNNGTTWTNAWQNTSGIEDSAWVQMDLDISSLADNNPAVYLRWTMGPTDSGWRYCGWNIDDIQVVSLDCTPPEPTLVAASSWKTHGSGGSAAEFSIDLPLAPPYPFTGMPGVETRAGGMTKLTFDFDGPITLPGNPTDVARLYGAVHAGPYSPLSVTLANGGTTLVTTWSGIPNVDRYVVCLNVPGLAGDHDVEIVGQVGNVQLTPPATQAYTNGYDKSAIGGYLGQATTPTNCRFDLTQTPAPSAKVIDAYDKSLLGGSFSGPVATAPMTCP